MSADLNPAVVAINSTISAPGEIDQYNFTVASDIKVVFDSLTNDPNMNWSLSGPQGAVVNGRNFTSSDSSNLGNNPVISLAAGNYTIAVNATSGATGGYGFRLLDLQSAVGVTHDTSVTGQISPANETDIYNFAATAGDHFFLDVTGRSGGDVTWQLLDPSGQQVFGPTVMNSASQDVDLPSLVTTGTYTLLVEGKIGSVEPANYSFNAQLLPTGYVAPAAPVTTNTWVGTAGGSWSTSTNWSTGTVPTATDNVYIGSLPAGQTVTISSGTVTINSLTCNCDLTISGGATLNLNGVSKINGKLTLAGGTLGGTGALTATGAFNVTRASTLSGTGTLTTQGVTTINMAAANDYLGLSKNWINQGTLTIGGDDWIYFGYPNNGGYTLTNAAGATLNLSSTYGTPIQNYSSANNTLNNAGTLNKTVAGDNTIAAAITFNNTGTVNVTLDRLFIEGSGTDTGKYNLAAGTVLGFTGNGKTRNLNDGASIGGAGTLALWYSIVNVNTVMDMGAGGTAIYLSSNGALNFNTTTTLGSLFQDGGTLGGSGAVTIVGAYTVRSIGSQSNLTGTGTFTTQGVSWIDLTGAGGCLGLSKNWINQGTLTVDGDDFIYFGYPNGGTNTLTNAAGGTLNLSSSNGTPLLNYSGTNTFNNAGTLNKTVANDNTIAANITFNNTGTVNVNTGRLYVYGNGTDTGT